MRPATATIRHPHFTRHPWPPMQLSDPRNSPDTETTPKRRASMAPAVNYGVTYRAPNSTLVFWRVRILSGLIGLIRTPTAQHQTSETEGSAAPKQAPSPVQHPVVSGSVRLVASSWGPDRSTRLWVGFSPPGLRRIEENRRSSELLARTRVPPAGPQKAGRCEFAPVGDDKPRVRRFQRFHELTRPISGRNTAGGGDKLCTVKQQGVSTRVCS